MSGVAATLLGLAFGFASALIPVINAEAYALASGIGEERWMLVPIIIALASGQTTGKLVLFEAARRGSTRFKAGPKLKAVASGRWAERIQRSLQAPRTASTVVLASASLGLPPLALVSVAAGAAGEPRRRFAIFCFIGRVVRFTALAAPVSLAVAPG